MDALNALTSLIATCRLQGTGSTRNLSHVELALCRAEVKVLVRDAEEAKRGYGPYVSVCGGSTGGVKGP